MTGLTLVLNAGSSSLKWAVLDTRARTIGEGTVERIGLNRGLHTVQWQHHSSHQTHIRVATHAAAVALVQGAVKKHDSTKSIGQVGHRFVHGGVRRMPLRLTRTALRQLARLDSLAPLHNPLARAVAVVALTRWPRAQHTAVFDTAFFHSLPAVARTYAVSPRLAAQYGLYRSGFHGLSHPLTLAQAARTLNRPLRRLNIIIAHLGSGCSVTAVRGGKPVDTSMGMTPLEGLVMMTRSGDLDPGIVLHLFRAGYSVDTIEQLLNVEAGIKGLTGSSDFRDVLATLGHPVRGYTPRRLARAAAQLAFDLFIYRLRKYLGAYSVVLGTVDAIVFTGVIGERSAPVRRAVLSGLRLPGRPRSLVIPSQEARAIALAIGRR